MADPVFATTADIASTEDKTPGCTLRFARSKHPFEPNRTLVHVRGSWVDGAYAPFPEGFKAKLKDVRPGGGGYAAAGGHYRVGYVFDVQGESAVETLLGWLAQAKTVYEARIPQTGKPAKVGTTVKKAAVLPTIT